MHTLWVEDLGDEYSWYRQGICDFVAGLTKR
jgi:hypothetical protein